MDDSSEPAIEAVLRILSSGLDELQLPDLRRPDQRNDFPPSSELMNWAVQAYCFCWLSHFRVILRGSLSLFDVNNAPALRFLVRGIYELSAHAHYVEKNIEQHLRSGNRDAVWDFLLPIGSGSFYLNRVYPGDSELFPSPARIGKVIKEFNDATGGDAYDNYGFQSEFCHPNMMAFGQYYDWDRVIVRFREPKVTATRVLLPTHAGLGAMLDIDSLLKLSDEKVVRAAIVDVLMRIAEMRNSSSGDGAI
jgi:hypothetical protein